MPGHQRRLASPRERHHDPREPVATNALGDSQRAADRSHLAGQRKLPDHRAALDVLRLELVGRDQQRYRERQVERGADLAQVRRREVDRDPPQRELVPRVDHRRSDPLARLAHGLVGEPHDRERGQALPDVGLHPDPPSVDPVDREGRDAGEHQAPPFAAAPTGAEVEPATSVAAACRRPRGETRGVIAPAARPAAGAIGEEAGSRLTATRRRAPASRSGPPAAGAAAGAAGAQGRGVAAGTERSVATRTSTAGGRRRCRAGPRGGLRDGGVGGERTSTAGGRRRCRGGPCRGRRVGGVGGARTSETVGGCE